MAKTHRALIVDEGWRSGSLSAEISARIMENVFYELDAPVSALCSAEVPMPYSQHMEEAALPQPETIVEHGQKGWCSDGEFRMPSLGADMDAGTLVEWKVKPGDPVKRGDIIAEVETAKGVIEIEVFEDGIVDQIFVPAGQEVPVGQVLATICAEGEMTGQEPLPPQPRRRRGRLAEAGHAGASAAAPLQPSTLRARPAPRSGSGRRARPHLAAGAPNGRSTWAWT